MDKLFDKITFEDTQGHPSTYKVWDSDAARIISEFTMAERRQNLMSGDGYNTIYAKLSRWYEDFKPIVFSGSYTDLENKPTIPNVYNGTLEIKRNGISVQTFSANSALNVIADIEVPEINDNVSSATTVYSSQRIDQLIRELGPNIIDNNDDDYEINADTINQITEQVLQRITIPPAEVDYTTIYSYIDSHMPTVGNGKLTVTVNGVKSIAQVSNGVPALLPEASNFFSANQTEDVELNLDIPQPIELIDNTTYSDNRTWSSSKIRSEILANGSLRMVVLAVGTSHTDIIGEANTIYFERITNEDLDNQYEEWVWTGDAWENIGRQIVDLSAYALRTDIKDAALSIVQSSGTTTFSANETNAKSVTIPQPDWSQTLATANDYIKNKPDFQLKIAGNEGEVIYHNGIDVFAQTIMNEGCVVTTAEDLTTCENSSPSFEAVFNTWKRFSHKGSVDDYQRGTAGSDYDSWVYLPESNTVNQPNNSTAYTGFISAKSYANYDIRVRVYSNDSDDDFIGLVAAFAEDGNGKEHTLSFLRTTNGTGINFTGCGWVCMLDFRGQSSKNEIGVDGLQILANKDSVMQIKNTNWADVNNDGASTGGTVISMVRTGNVITAKCSEFGTSELVSESTITIDLDDTALTTQYPTLNLFKGSAPWGYSTYSQKNSRYENISITDPDNTIYDFVNNRVLQYNSQNRQWEAMQNEDPYSSLGAGRFNYNSITGKLFYNTGRSIIQIPTQIQSDWNQSDSTAKDYIKNKPTISTGITVVNASSLSNNALTADVDVNTLVILTGTSSQTTYTYTNNAGTEKHLKGNPDYDIVFRYCGNNKFQPITLPIPID